MSTLLGKPTALAYVRRHDRRGPQHIRIADSASRISMTAPAEEEPVNSDATIASAMVVLDHIATLEPFLPELAPSDRERVDAYVARASAEATLRAYKSDWRLFCAWCGENGYRPLPAKPATVAAFLTLLAERGFVPAEPRRTKRG